MPAFQQVQLASIAAAGGTTVSDDFNRANEIPLGGNWTKITGAAGGANLISNAVFTTSAISTIYTWNAATPTADQYSQIVPVAVLNFNGPLVRGQTPFTGYMAGIVDSTHVEVNRIVNGAFGTLSTVTTSTITAGTTIVGLSVSGTGATVTLKLYLGTYPGTQQGSDITDSDAARIVTAGSVGFYLEDITAGIDNWTAGW